MSVQPPAQENCFSMRTLEGFGESRILVCQWIFAITDLIGLPEGMNVRIAYLQFK